MFVHSCQAMRQAEQTAIGREGVSSASLMQCAIDHAVDVLRRDVLFADVVRRFPCAVVYVGKGNNAGDAIGIAHALGFRRILLRCAETVEMMSPEARHRLELVPFGCLVISRERPQIGAEGALFIDGLLGSGARGELRQEYAILVQELNSLRASSPRSITLAVDIPTGLQADTGAKSEFSVRADATLAIGCVKPGMLVDGAEDFVGRILCVPLPEADPGESDLCVADEGLLQLLPRRAYSCFKNCAGRVRILAGSPGLIGAACMASEAALHAGAGLVELYCPRSIYSILAVKAAPEVMVHGVQNISEVPQQGAQALLVGPGLGPLQKKEAEAIQELWRAVDCPVVLDADALNAIAAHGLSLPQQAILTPHPGEMRRLFPGSVALSRTQTALQFAIENSCTLLLKGARSIVTDGVSMCYNSSGGPFMATGGQGDVLAGVVAALAAAGLSCFHAAALGAYLCGRAAEQVWAYRGFPQSVPSTSLLPYLTAIV